MALSNAEIQRIRFELGFHVLTSSAEPYISYISVFDQIIQPYTSAGASTTSSTTVAAATTPTPVALTLASATGFAAGDRVAIDVDDRQETSTVQFVSGNVITALLTKAHTGGASTYPVTVEGGESIVREILKKIRDVKTRMSTTFGAGSLKKVDEIEFYQSGTLSLFGSLGSELSYWREELASALGIVSMWSLRRAGGLRLSAY